MAWKRGPGRCRGKETTKGRGSRPFSTERDGSVRTDPPPGGGTLAAGCSPSSPGHGEPGMTRVQVERGRGRSKDAQEGRR